MTFEVYNVVTAKPILSIQEEKVIFLNENFKKSLQVIFVGSCYKYYSPTAEQKDFPNVTEVRIGDKLYPKALKMYCKAQLLTHSEYYAKEMPST